MIHHIIGADTRLDYNWTTPDGALVVPADATFDVTDTAGESVMSMALGDPGLTTTAQHSIELHLEEDAITEGFYEYKLRVNDGVDWYYLSAGLLRAK